MSVVTETPITARKPSRAEAEERLMQAVSQAVQEGNIIYTGPRWHGWFAWQTGIDLPDDIFQKLVESVDFLAFATEFGTPEQRVDAQAAVEHYKGACMAVVLGRIL